MLNFDNSFVRALPADPETDNHRRQVAEAAYSRVEPTRASAPRLLAYSAAVAGDLGLSEADCRSEAFLQAFAGNQLLPGMEPHAMVYGGHQFGNWAGQLGDGRAINLGEVVAASGRQTLQLKGAGPTPYSRGADGYAVLRSSVREFLCSEAMHHLGVPTTRALSLITTGDTVVRDMFYDGNPQPEPGAVVCRVAPSFIRFGNFELPTSRRDYDLLKQMLDYTIATHFPQLLPASGEPEKSTYLAWFEEVCQRTLTMIVHWQRVGFVHGVMNTDNMSVHGLTIDYGPYGWLEGYDPDWTPNTTDAQGRRYRFGNQPGIAQWNLAQLANAIHPLIEDTTALEASLSDFGENYWSRWRTMMGEKLGFATAQTEDVGLLEELVQLLQAHETDMTIFFRQLAAIGTSETELSADDSRLVSPLLPAYYGEPDADMISRTAQWLRRYQQRLLTEGRSDSERAAAMNQVNPLYVLRNYLAQQAIDKAEQGDPSMIHELLDVLRHPYDEQPGKESFTAKRPEWARHKAGCSMLSCSS